MILYSLFLLLLSNGITIRKDVSILYSRITIFILLHSILLIYESFYVSYIEKGIGLYNGLFNVTSITHIFQAFIFLASLIILFLTGFYPRKLYKESKKLSFDKITKLIINKMAEQYTIIEYALIILFIIMGSSLLLSSGDFISLFLSIELQSYGLYILSVIYRDSESATSSGLTYFLLGGLSSCFILLGIVFIYVNTGISNLDSFYSITNLTVNYEYISPWYKSQFITYSLLIISVGLLFKIGAAPFHFWSPDVYDGIPTIVTTFVANLAKVSLLVFMLEIIHYTSDTLMKNTFDWTTGLLISCLLSLIIGTVLGLTQTRIKRLFAYSTISHVGFLLLALSVNNIESSKAFIFYLIQYILTNINAFIILIAIGYSLYIYSNNNLIFVNLKDKNNSPVQLINQIKGYFYINPILALCLCVVMLSFVGLPPLVGFFAKQMILSSALDNGFVFLVLIAVITSVIGAVYYLGIIKTMFFEKSEYNKSNINLNIILSSYLSLPISILTLFILLFILIPNEILNLSNILSLFSFSECNFEAPSYHFSLNGLIISYDNTNYHLDFRFNIYIPHITLNFDFSSLFSLKINNNINTELLQYFKDLKEESLKMTSSLPNLTESITNNRKFYPDHLNWPPCMRYDYSTLVHMKIIDFLTSFRENISDLLYSIKDNVTNFLYSINNNIFYVLDNIKSYITDLLGRYTGLFSSIVNFSSKDLLGFLGLNTPIIGDNDNIFNNITVNAARVIVIEPFDMSNINSTNHVTYYLRRLVSIAIENDGISRYSPNWRPLGEFFALLNNNLNVNTVVTHLNWVSNHIINVGRFESTGAPYILQAIIDNVDPNTVNIFIEGLSSTLNNVTINHINDLERNEGFLDLISQFRSPDHHGFIWSTENMNTILSNDVVLHHIEAHYLSYRNNITRLLSLYYFRDAGVVFPDIPAGRGGAVLDFLRSFTFNPIVLQRLNRFPLDFNLYMDLFVYSSTHEQIDYENFFRCLEDNFLKR